MTVRDTLDEVLRALPEEGVREVLNFARFVSMEEEAKEWEQFGLAQLAHAYGPNEPECAAADHNLENL